MRLPSGSRQYREWQRVSCTDAGNGAFFHGHTRGGKVCDDLREGHSGEKAKVGATGGRARGLWLELVPRLMQINLLYPEPQRHAPTLEGLDRHSEHARIPVAGRVEIAYREHEMVETIHPHGLPLHERSDTRGHRALLRLQRAATVRGNITARGA